MKEVVLNCLGEACPALVIKTEDAMKELAVGDELVVQCDHICASKNISEWAYNNGHHAELLEVNYGEYEITIEKLK